MAHRSAALYGLIFALTPWGFDDFSYTLGTFGCDSAADVTAGVWDNVVDRWFYDTGRLANIISPLFLGLLPHWIFAVISGLMVWLTFFFGMKIARVDAGSFWAYFIVFALTFALPWLDFAFTVIFALNYVWTGALTVAALYFLFCKQPDSPAAKAGVYILAIAAGWMHEGFSVPVLAGLFAWILWRRGRLSRVQWVIAICYAVGFALILCSPAVSNRMGRMVSDFTRFTPTETLLHAVAFNLMTYAFMILLAIVLCRKSLRKSLFEDKPRCEFIVFALAATLVAFAMFFILYKGPRLGWAGTLTATLGLAALLQRVCPINRLWSRILSLVMAACVTVNLCGTVVIQCDYLKESRIIPQLFIESETGEVFYDNLPMKLDISCFKTSSRCFNESMPQQVFSDYYANSSGKQLQLLPSALKDFKAQGLTVSPADSNIYMYKGLLLTRRDVPRDSKIILVTDKLGTVESRLRARPFTASDSTRWYLLLPTTARIYHLTILSARFPE